MDILLISRCPPFPLYHGDRLIPYHLAHELAARHYQIDLLAFYPHSEDIAEVPRYESLFRSVTLIREPQRSALSYLRRVYRPGTRFSHSAKQSWSPEMWHAVQQMIEEHTYDIAHLFGGVQVYEYFPLVQDLPNVIVPYESYSLWLERALQEEQKPLARLIKRFQRQQARNFESWMFEKFDRTVVLTERDANVLKALNSYIPLVTIPNGVDVDYFMTTGYEAEEPALLFVGNYDYAPNLDAALRLARDIFPRIKQQMTSARLYLVGGNPPPELQAYASDDIDIAGRVPDVRTYFEASMIFISPLRLGAGIKNKILESMAMETPVVATSLSCDGIPVVTGKHVMIGNTDDELIAGVIRLLHDARLRQNLRKNGRRLIDQFFTWRRVAEQYEELYLQIIQSRRGSTL